MNLSAHVTLAEFQVSGIATLRGIKNEMSLSQIESAKLLCENVFEPLRIHLNTPIQISSGFRSLQVNRLIGGAKTSQHTKGEAMDLQIGAKGFNFIKDKLDFDQLIWEFGNDENPAWVHVSYSSKNRKQVLKSNQKKWENYYSNY